jgi:hypothetical protein
LTSRTSLAAIMVVGALAGLASQALPPAPTNLRIVTGKTPKPPAPPSCVVVPPATGKPAHAYFESLVRRPEHSCNWSLRDQAQLNSLTNDPVSQFFTYSPLTDSYQQKQDAAKFFVPAGRPSASIPGTQQLKMYLPAIESGSILITWDWYWGPEFRENRGAMRNYKSWQVQMGGHGWWTLMANLNAQGAGEVANTSDEFRSGLRALGMVRSEKVSPAGPGTPSQYPDQTYAQFHSRWTRYWVEVKLLQPPSAFKEWSNAYLGGAPLPNNTDDPEGRWHMVSLWSADEHRPAQRLLYRIPMNWQASKWEPRVNMFKFEMNSSQAEGFVGPWVGYGRNVAILHNYPLPSTSNPESDPIFERPQR